MKIQKLPAEARSKLQSGMLVTDAVQCVLELVHNSLDAEATGVAVRVDLKTYQIRVIDNGKGIGKDDLEFVGERFMTTKYRSSLESETPFPTYGFRGQALSSLQDVSRTLTFETKSEDGGPTFVKVFQNNKPLPITERDSDRNGTGTTVTVDDFMYTMPVRRKRISEVFDMEEIKTQLEYLAIIHYNVCFTLRNENKGIILLQTPQASSILESVTNIYGKTVAKSLKALNYEEKKYEITGFISLKPQAQSNVQLLYINKRIVSKGVIHKFVNHLIKEYCGKKSLLGDSSVGQILKKLKFSHNIYILQIKCPHSYYELFTNVRKVTVEFRNWKDPLKCIHKAVKRAFKGTLKLDSSLNTQDHDDKNEEDNNNEGRRLFGTSLLVNAVRGAAAKRSLNYKTAKKRKRNDGKDKSVILSKIRKRLDESSQVVGNLNSTIYQKSQISNDSLETPIPKKAFKNVKQIDQSKWRKTDINQSFVEFYEWLKTNFETDTQAFNLYNDFLQFKNRNTCSEITEFKSPVLGGKPKRKPAGTQKKKSVEKKPKTPSNELSLLNEQVAVVTHGQLKIFPNQYLRMRKAVQLTTEMNPAAPEGFHFDCIRRENDNFEISKNQFKKPQSFSFMRRKERQIEYGHTLQSLPSSEVQFTNVIKFRNMSESFFHQSSDQQHMLSEKRFSDPNTWVSHYQGSKNLELYEKKQDIRSFLSWLKANEGKSSQRNKVFESFNIAPACDARLVEFANTQQKVQDVEVQVNLLSLPAQKVNVMVQTYQEVPETPSFENSYVFSPGVGVAVMEDTKEYPEHQFVNDNFSVEVPNPDFWNCTNHIEFEVNNQSKLVVKELTSSKSSNDITSKKNLSSNEFVCGHKSQVSTKVESTSKETQTLAAIWTDSLTEVGHPAEDTRTPNLKNSKLENTQLSQSNTVAKTIPIEEINCDMAESGFCQTERSNVEINCDSVESRFCMTERHDFVPKGLSPKFLNPETTAIASLSPSEKCRIQLTIDNTQNEFLAMVKWQNESTGDCLKPAIPDGIIFEMRRKAGESLMNYENPVLSATLSYCAVKVHNLLHSFAFTKELLSGVEVLGQLDKKFIVTKMKIYTPRKMELISLFDQHAADERIKLEELINENMSSDGKFTSSRLRPPVECTLTESDIRVVADLREKMLNFGLNAEPISGDTVSVNEVPTFLLKKHENDLKIKREISISDAVRALILNIIEEVTETRGVLSKIPKVMHSAFCLEACHKAIKFNKCLSIENMVEMIVKLQNCKLPFQCAHGRPSVIPLIDIEDFKPMMEENESLDFNKFKKFLNERKGDSVVENSKASYSNT